MQLTDLERDMLEGKYGEGTALAMRVQVGVGKAFDAERMVPITRAHVALSAQDADLWFVSKLLDGGAHCVVSPTVNPSIDIAYLDEHLWAVPQEGKDIVSATNEAYTRIGATMTLDCAPGLEKNVPAFGEVLAFSESSATPYVNSVLGARTNRESAHSAPPSPAACPSTACCSTRTARARSSWTSRPRSQTTSTTACSAGPTP